MKDTTVKVSSETRDRIRAMGGAIHESERFWVEAEQGKKWLDSLTEQERRQLRDEDDAIDALFNGI